MTGQSGEAMEMMKLGQNGDGERETDTLVPIEVQPQYWVGIYPLKKLPVPFQQEGSYSFKFCFEMSSWAKSVTFEKNRLTLVFCPSLLNQTLLVRYWLDKMSQKSTRRSPRFKIVLLDAKDSENLKLSFQKVAKAHLPKIPIDKENFPNEKTVSKIYEEMSRENGPKYKSLFVLVGPESLSEIQQFLPQRNLVLPFCRFLVTTSSKTFHWESESESEEWSIEKLLMSDKGLLEFDWEGVHFASKLPASFQPVPHFSGRHKSLSQLVQRFQADSPRSVSDPAPVQHCDCCVRWGKRTEFLLPKPKPKPAPSSSLTVITGLKNIGKTELLKKFLSTHPHPFSKVVLVNATNSSLSLKVFAYNSEIYSERAVDGANESESESDKFAFLYSQVTKDLQGDQKILLVFDYAADLEHIKDFLPLNSGKDGGVIQDCQVLVTSRNRNWKTEDHLKFYRENNYDFKEIRLFDGLSLEETHLFFSKLLPRHGILYNREDLERAIKELHKFTGGFPPYLKHLSQSISESSRTNPEWPPKLHVLNYLCRSLQDFQDESWSFWLKEPLLVSLCLMSPDHLNFDLILSFFNSCITNTEQEENAATATATTTAAATVTAEQIDQWLRRLELDSLIQVDRKDEEEGGLDKLERIPIRIPDFLRERVRYYQKPNCPGVYKTMRSILSGATPLGSSSSWKMPLHEPRLRPHILSFNETHNRYHGYYNEFLIECIQNHLKSSQTDQILERDEINQLLEREDPDFKGAFGEFPKLKKREFVAPVFFLILFVVDVSSDLYNSLIIWRAGYASYCYLALFLVVVPFIWLCVLHKIDRAKYNAELKSGHLPGRADYWKTFFGTLHSYFSQLWYTWKFWRATENLKRGLLYERLCVLRANAGIQGIAEGFMESLPQLLLQFPLYLLSYTEEYSELGDVMQGSVIPFELSLVVSLLSLGLALTKLESVYFGWNIDLFGLKLLGYRSIHFLLNVTHTATLVFCSGMVSVVFPWFIFITPLVFCLTAAAWILSNTKNYRGRNAKSSYLFCRTFFRGCSESDILSPRVTCSDLVVFFASFHPGFVNEAKNLEFATKHEFVSARLGHDLLFLQRRPKRSDMIYLSLFFASILISTSTVVYSSFYEDHMDKSTETDLTELIWPFRVIQENSFYFLLWLPVLFMWQILRQILNIVYLKYAKVPLLTEDYILNDPEGIIRYPVSSERWIQRRLYYQMRPNQPGVFGQTWEQVKESVSSVKRSATFFIENLKEESYGEILETLLWMWIKVICKVFYFLFLILALCLVPHTLTLLKMDSSILSSNSSLNKNESLFP